MKQKPRMYRGKIAGEETWVEGWYATAEKQHWIEYENEECVGSELIDPSTLGQSTGELDKTGAKLWEDDVCVDLRGDRWLIIWKKASFWLENMETKCRWMLDGSKVEKIGTMYDSAEVLYKGAPRRWTGGHDDDE